MANYFSFEIDAPQGLEGIEGLLSDCELDLEAYSMSSNKKVILRAKQSSGFKWSMDYGYDGILYGDGEIFTGEDFTISALEAFSNVLSELKLPHIIRIDDEGSMLIKVFRYEWPEERYT